MKNDRKSAVGFSLTQFLHRVATVARRVMNTIVQPAAVPTPKNSKDHEEALARYEQDICLHPDSALAYYGKGSALRDLMRYEEAIVAYEQVIRLDRTLASWAYFEKGNVFRHLTRYEEALFAYEQAIRLDREFASAYLEKGNTLRLLGKNELAQDAYEHVIRLRPQSADAYYGLSAVGGSDEAYQKARELDGFATGLEHSPLPLLLRLLR